MTCPKCRCPNEPGANFCLRCGETLAPVPVTPPQPKPAAGQSRGYTMLLVITATAFLLTVAGILFATLKIGNEESEEPIPVFNTSPDTSASMSVQPSASSGQTGDVAQQTQTPQPMDYLAPTNITVYAPEDGTDLLPEKMAEFISFSQSTCAFLDEGAAMACDGDLNSGWRGTEGVGDWIEFAAQAPQTVTKVTLQGVSGIENIHFFFNKGASVGEVTVRLPESDSGALVLEFPHTFNASLVRMTVTAMRNGETEPVILEAWFS